MVSIDWDYRSAALLDYDRIFFYVTVIVLRRRFVVHYSGVGVRDRQKNVVFPVL